MPNTILHIPHVVDKLPHGASVLRVDDEEAGVIHTYYSRTASVDDIAQDLAWVATAQMERYCLKSAV